MLHTFLSIYQIFFFFLGHGDGSAVQPVLGPPFRASDQPHLQSYAGLQPPILRHLGPIIPPTLRHLEQIMPPIFRVIED